MNIQSRVALFMALLLINGCTSSDGVDTQAKSAEPMAVLVSTEWLSAHLNDPDLVVLDCSVIVKQGENGHMLNESGRAAYKMGHIPGAGFADLLGDLSDRDNPFDFGMPTPEQLSAAMGGLQSGSSAGWRP